MQFQRLIGLAAMVYEPLYHTREIASIVNCLLVALTKRSQQNLAIFVDDF